MTLAEDVAAAAAEVGTSAQAAADRVTAAIGGLRTQLADATGQIQALIDAGNADATQLTATLETLASADAIVDSIEAAPVVEPPVEPTV